MPGGDSVAIAASEIDTTAAPASRPPLAPLVDVDLNRLFGRVLYTHGHGVDRPCRRTPQILAGVKPPSPAPPL